MIEVITNKTNNPAIASLKLLASCSPGMVFIPSQTPITNPALSAHENAINAR